ncbi:MAG: FAD-binding oxidoreductase [Rhodobacteraceae bacterium]|nr:FAD-binding oxidoreductase [Paracoccaceae bacterium]
MTADFLIIGGGIAGVSAAARLSELGTVTLLEGEDHLAYHTSGRSAALYEPRYGLKPVVELSLAAEDYLRTAHGGVLSPRGMMVVAGPEEGESFRQDCAGFGLKEISVDEARAIVPILNPETVARTAIADHAWDIDTDLLIQNFAREARGRGAEILTGRRVTTLSRVDGAWRAATASEAYTGRILVNAAGAWADLVAGMAGARPLGLTPYRRSMARIPAPGGLNISSWPMIFGTGETWYAKPDAGALIVSPAEEHAMEPHDAWADDMVLAEGLSRYEARVTTPVTRLLASWAGLRTFAADRVLVIGPDPDLPGFFWLAGQGGYGFQTSAAASRLAADLLGSRKPEIAAATVAALSPARFR